ncbi:hypothetical protein OK348_13265 [Flavobacterium sp. MXW15]|uniref:Transmembrane protein n=1 Tax=Xanthomonas chitinilytica TaxID=2989819 RepID=A0ABT3JWY8_9XANT|nr:hypothetical protein [Xanthomonas sp. H13-6]MCW4455755.1 hypothetical protein [Flavobacterium sp. MXW15]MCW4472971.1 hypothetical protein [Xanthomonas sp. H13-6]
MKQLFRHGTLALGIAATLTPVAAQAGDIKLNKSEVSTLVVASSVVLVVSGPVFLSAAGVRKAGDASRESREGDDGKPRRISAGPIPDMQVKSVDSNEDGGRRVALEDPADPRNTATLQWPQRQDDPAALFSVGQTVAFTPSPQGSGWMLRAEDGAALAFVPTAQAAADSHSQAW